MKGGKHHFTIQQVKTASGSGFYNLGENFEELQDICMVLRVPSHTALLDTREREEKKAVEKLASSLTR